MATKLLTIKQLSRSPQFGPEDELHFSPGVNVIVGQPNTGKSKWLRMLDYLMGDPSTPGEAFGDEDLAEKYDSIQAVFSIEEEEIVVERRWKQQGTRGKVFVNDEPIQAEEFSRYLLERLEIPNVHYPQGDPYRERKWPQLSWRSLLRHIYRQQRFWSDIADKQPESEQHACLLLFLGVAEHIFSSAYEESVMKRKQLYQLQGAKDQFTKMLEQLSKELISDENLRVALTPQSIDTAMAQLQGEIAALGQQRTETLTALLNADAASHNGHSGLERSEIDKLGDEWVRLQEDRERIVARLSQATKRLYELQNYRTAVAAELARLERTKVATRVFAPLKVTSCPVCSQSVEHFRAEEGQCFLCHQSLLQTGTDTAANERRIGIEEQQLKSELQEVDELTREFKGEQESELVRQRQTEEQAQHIAAQLGTVRQALASILPPDLAVIDMERGRAEERINQLQRLNSTLNLREQMAKEIDDLQEEATSLDARVDAMARVANSEQASDALSNGMNTYLNAITVRDNKAWTQESIRVRIRDRSFAITVGGSNWAGKLGGTMTMYFLLSYHYALLSLSLKPDFHYPGLTILDLPATLDGGIQVRDQENYILEPFVQLTLQPDLQGIQVIAAGSAFEGLGAIRFS